MATNEPNDSRSNRPNILILCMDQWDTHMDVPKDVEFPAMERLEARGVAAWWNAGCTRDRASGTTSPCNWLDQLTGHSQLASTRRSARTSWRAGCSPAMPSPPSAS